MNRDLTHHNLSHTLRKHGGRKPMTHTEPTSPISLPLIPNNLHRTKRLGPDPTVRPYLHPLELTQDPIAVVLPSDLPRHDVGEERRGDEARRVDLIGRDAAEDRGRRSVSGLDGHRVEEYEVPLFLVGEYGLVAAEEFGGAFGRLCGRVIEERRSWGVGSGIRERLG